MALSSNFQPEGNFMTVHAPTKNDRNFILEVLKNRQCVRVSGREAELLSFFYAQLGEIGWHSTHLDAGIDDVSESHAARMLELASTFPNPRILELGAYAHHSAHIAAAKLNGLAVSHDISAASLEVASARAKARGYLADHISVAGDFHSLPFNDGSFDCTFIASSVHHTWRPWELLREMVRVTRPGGIIHIENEPVRREACLYHFRGNRAGQMTEFERRIDAAGLTQTISSPFPGSRAEQLFGMIENDRIPVDIFERELLSAGEALEWHLDPSPVINEFERWLIDLRPSAETIANRLFDSISHAAQAFSEVDKVCGFSIPGADHIWPLAYRTETELARPQDQSDMAFLFGAALRATIRKAGNKRVSKDLFRRSVRQVGGVMIDDEVALKHRIDFNNVLPGPEHGDFGSDWCVMPEALGLFSLSNIGADCRLPINEGNGFLILRAYSVAASEPYYFSVMRNDELAYSHCVAMTDSHLAKIYLKRGDEVTVYHHNESGEPVDVQYHTRLTPKFVRDQSTS